MLSRSISVIVAVYNVELWIRRALECLFSQTYKNIEIIIIDDGSSDTSAKICDEYIQDDESCIVFHKMNAGVSSARQVGLMAISGEYVIHADPDDWTDLTFLEKMYEVAKNDNADMVLGAFYRNYPDGTQLFFKNKPSSLDHETVLFSSFTYLNGSCWNKLIKRSVIKNINFCDSLAYREDSLFNARILQEQIKISYLSQGLVHYCCDFRKSLTKLDIINHYNHQKKFLFACRKYIKQKYHKQCLTNEEQILAMLSLVVGGTEIKSFHKSFPLLQKEYYHLKIPRLRKILYFLSFHGFAKFVSYILKWRQIRG